MTKTISNGIDLVPENTLDPAAGLNLALDQIDFLLQPLVEGFQDGPPSAAADGERWVVGVGSGDWLGHDGEIARYDATGDSWGFMPAAIVVSKADGKGYWNNGGTWTALVV